MNEISTTAETRNAYSAPVLCVYGTMIDLTATGSKNIHLEGAPGHHNPIYRCPSDPGNSGNPTLHHPKRNRC